MVQADARAQMTGRVVDSYTNIQTIKLFAHTLREQDYARDAMDEFMVTVYRQMRLVTALNMSLHVTNSLLLAAVAGVAIYGWLQEIISLGAIAVAIAPGDADPRHVAVDPVGDRGSVREHRHGRRTASAPSPSRSPSPTSDQAPSRSTSRAARSPSSTRASTTGASTR